MTRGAQAEISMRIVVDEPVIGVFYSLQDKDGGPLDPKMSVTGEPLYFDFPVRIGNGPKFFGEQVRREGPERRFVYVRVGQLAGDPASPWSRRIKIDIHDIAPVLLDQAVREGRMIETRIIGTGQDGTPACATQSPTKRSVL